MKHTLLIASLLVMNLCGAQDISRDTLALKEVRIDSRNLKPKLKKQKINGCTHIGSLDHPQEIITLIDKLPEGLLYSVTFSFNNKVSKYVTFSDTELELVAYETGSDGTPGRLIASKQVILSKNHAGSMEIDIADLSITSGKPFFLGLKKISRQTSPVVDFAVDCVCSRDDDKYISYGRFYVQGVPRAWGPISVPAAIKMTVKTDVCP